MQKVSQINFNGQFKYEKLKPKQSKELKKILTTEYNGVTNEELLKKMPFDVDVYCFNPSKKAINPRFNFSIKYTKKNVPLFGYINLNSKNPLEKNVEDLNNFIIKGKEKIDSIKGDEKLTSAEETRRQVGLLLFGKW